MEKIPSTMVLHKNIDKADNRFATMTGLLANHPLEEWLGVIRRVTYQAGYKDSRWEYELVYDLLPGIEHTSVSSDDGSSDDRSKDQENTDDQEK